MQLSALLRERRYLTLQLRYLMSASLHNVLLRLQLALVHGELRLQETCRQWWHLGTILPALLAASLVRLEAGPRCVLTGPILRCKGVLRIGRVGSIAIPQVGDGWSKIALCKPGW